MTGTAVAGWLLLVAAVVGFLAGSINPATLVARAKGVDLSVVGSGNPGATNTARALGRNTGVLVGVIDVLKGLLPTLLFGLADPVAGQIAGFFAVLGHMFSPFLKGHGGKGVATTLGVILGVAPIWALPILGAFVAGLAITKRMGLASVCAALALIACGIWGAETASASILAISLGILVLVRHRANIRQAWAQVRGGAAGI